MTRSVLSSWRAASISAWALISCHMASPDGARARQLFYLELSVLVTSASGRARSKLQGYTKLYKAWGCNARECARIYSTTHACMQTQNGSSYFKAREQVETVLLWQGVYQSSPTYG
jgi:hypothetical protein